MNIYDLKPLNKLNDKQSYICVCFPDGETKTLSESFDIEDGTLFLTIPGRRVFSPLRLDSLLNYLDHERQNDSWLGDKTDALLKALIHCMIVTSRYMTLLKNKYLIPINTVSNTKPFQ